MSSLALAPPLFVTTVPSTSPAKGAVSIRDVSKAYRLDGRELPVLDGINLEV